MIEGFFTLKGKIVKGIDLKIFRTIFSLSQREAAEEIGGVSQRAWVFWEQDGRTIPVDVQDKISELMARMKQTLEFVRGKGREAKKIAVLFYNNPQDAGMTLLEVRYNNALASILKMEMNVIIVPFEPQGYVDWLTENGLIDSPQKRSEWAAYKANEI